MAWSAVKPSRTKAPTSNDVRSLGPSVLMRPFRGFHPDAINGTLSPLHAGPDHPVSLIFLG
ncbi:hypothetical protein [Arthrobacter sp. CDRTa11]|uniref:hypothetical protein n=1 Tax=Arthrobacter sp. CDRTa11 TaxID=2651199 RepID=UPI0022658467|nr:hypothetical protein [Arthrobacter sp. CDRTa11]